MTEATNKITALSHFKEDFDLKKEMAPPVIFSTEDYEQFKLLGGNRSIKKRHVEKLCASIQSKNELPYKPIIVNSAMEVVDGQHRLEAAKELGIAIYYVIDDDYAFETLINLNQIQMHWVDIDYINFYHHQGREPYTKILELIKKSRFSAAVVMLWCGVANARRRDIFRRGGFLFENYGECVNRLNYASSIYDIIYERWGTQTGINHSPNFHRSLKFLLSFDFVDREKLYDRLEKTPIDFNISASVTGYLENLLGFYNWKMRQRIVTVKDEKGRVIDLMIRANGKGDASRCLYDSIS